MLFIYNFFAHVGEMKQANLPNHELYIFSYYQNAILSIMEYHTALHFAMLKADLHYWANYRSKNIGFICATPFGHKSYFALIYILGP